ncbi:alpha/beta hydrolase [Nocardioides sp. SLBN-35]|uniref:alpha/beta hydrolase n=1 Tax=Nocardioides sp. SLBN-35 TaxID=2768445 RepID=UPI00117389E5|nr:alpha/beta hydrolase [Nocardioides sp. SLBN-35]TQK68518.1 TAP-like protein [Nocardioides sp. SLBN-35]
MKRALTIVASVATATALLVPGGSSNAAPQAPQVAAKAPSYTPPAPVWGACTSQRLTKAGAQCAMLEVPLDYDKPKGKKIQIAISRVLHTNPDYKGVITANPGGPGGSGLVYPAVLPGLIPNGVGAKYDWYGFDPRGVGSSTPSLSCNPNYKGQDYDRPNYVPTKKKNLKWWQRVTKRYAKACSKADAKRLLKHMHTTDVAQDLESLRKAAGAPKLNYYGFSYGTYLGQVYATMYPKKVGRFVWDGVLNADRAFYESNVDQNIQFDKNIRIYFKWLAQNDAVYGLGTSGKKIRKGYYKLLKKLDKHPAADGKLGPDELGDVLLNAGYYVNDWAELGAAYAKLVKTGDGADLLDGWYGGPGDDNGFAVYNAVQCTDAVWPNWKKTEADAWRVHKKHPFLTWGNTWYNAPCLNWPAPSRKAFEVSGKKVKSPILMIGETNDAATVFSGALATRQKFKTSFLIEGKGGTTHSGSLSGVACTDDLIASYLDTGVLPKRKKHKGSDLKCAPAPVPAASVSARGTAQRPAVGSTDELRKLLMEAQASGR